MERGNSEERSNVPQASVVQRTDSGVEGELGLPKSKGGNWVTIKVFKSQRGPCFFSIGDLVPWFRSFVRIGQA